MDIPVVVIAEAEVKIVGPDAGGAVSGNQRSSRKIDAALQALRWNDYGIALFEQAQYGAAAEVQSRSRLRYRTVHRGGADTSNDLVAINSINPDLVPGAPGEAQIADYIARWLSAPRT